MLLKLLQLFVPLEIPNDLLEDVELVFGTGGQVIADWNPKDLVTFMSEKIAVPFQLLREVMDVRGKGKL